MTRIEPNDGLINANDVWVQAPATDTASNGIAATLAGKHSGKKKKKGRLQGVDCDGRLCVCTLVVRYNNPATNPPYVISRGRLPSTSHPATCLSSSAKLGALAANQ